MGAICKAMPNPERVFFWTSSGNDVPVGRRLGWSCAVPYCGKYEHMQVVENKTSGWNNWKQYTSRIEQMRIDESFDVLDVPNNAEFLVKFRCGIASSIRGARFIIRSLPTGGVRVIRTGTYGSIWSDIEEVITEKYYPVLNRKFRKPLPSLEAGAFFLGLLWGTSLHRDRVPTGSTCISRGCPFPAMHEGKCRRHATFFEYMESMEGRDFDYDDIYASEDNPEPRFSTMFGYEIDYSYRQTKFLYRGVFDHKSKLADSYLGEQ